MSDNLNSKFDSYIGPIDPEARLELEALQQPDEENLYQAVLLVYVKDSIKTMKLLNDYVSSIETANPGRDWVSETQVSEIENSKNIDPGKLAHSWKSSSYSVGARQLSNLCGQLEATKAAQIDERIVLIQKIKSEYILVKAALEKQN